MTKELSNIFDQFDKLTLGFGPLFRDIQINTNTYPPHNILEISDTEFILELALAGFKKHEIKIEEGQGVLTVSADKETKDVLSYRHKGIATRKFSKSFRIAEFYEITDAFMEDGILSIKFTKIVPEEETARTINIR